MRGYNEKLKNLQPRRGLSPDQAGLLGDLDFQPPEVWAINFCCFEATQMRHFVRAAGVDYDNI